MLKFEKDITAYLTEIYKNTGLSDHVYSFELPLNYDYKKNKIGIYYNYNSIDDNEYKNVISLDVNFYCLEDDKISMLEILNIFDKALNKKDINNYWITHKPVFLIPIKEDNLYHYVLSYNVNKY